MQLIADARTVPRAKSKAAPAGAPKKASASPRTAWLTALRQAGRLIGAQDSDFADLQAFLATDIGIGDVAQSFI